MDHRHFDVMLASLFIAALVAGAQAALAQAPATGQIAWQPLLVTFLVAFVGTLVAGFKALYTYSPATKDGLESVGAMLTTAMPVIAALLAPKATHTTVATPLFPPTRIPTFPTPAPAEPAAVSTDVKTA